MEEFVNNLKRQAEENPVLAMGVAAGLMTAISQLLNATTSARNSRVWAKEVDRRIVKASRK